jgi:DNA-binding SARP family transcriptional activator/tetratricopeptide (TPR) repeat protein
VEFRILGPLAIESEAGPVRLNGLRERKLLAILLLNANTMVPSARLNEAIWDEPPLTARQQIHNIVARLRRTLAATANGVEVVTGHAGYQIRVPEDRLDVARFRLATRHAEEAEATGRVDGAVQRLIEALGLWRGAALPELDGTVFASAAAQLEEERLAAVERLVSLRLRRGESSGLISDLIGLVAMHPLREALRATLMTALHLSGRQAEALAVYEEGRRYLAEELGLDPGPRLRRLHDQILKDLPVTAGEGTTDAVTSPGRASDDTSARPPTAGRSFLPYATREFAGRVVEVARLVKEAESGNAEALVISAIDGMGGVGKTALAVYVAHQLAEQYPDGQYFVDLHGFSEGLDPLTPDAALEVLLLDSGVPAELIPIDVERRSAMWRAKIAGNRALLLLDNAVDAAQVRPLLPGTPGSTVLVTSRRRLPGLEGAVPLSLDVLPPDDASALFVKVIGVEPSPEDEAAISEAAELCGYLPLAIRIAAARLRDRASWRPRDLVNQLRDQRRRTQFLAAGDRSVFAALSLSYRYLTQDQRRLFRLLSLHPGPEFDAYTAAAVSGLGVEEAEEHVEVLFDDNLLLQPSPGRYQFHDLIKDCARHLLEQCDDEPVRTAARQRLLDYYLDLAHRLCEPMAVGPFRLDLDVPTFPQAVSSPASNEDRLDRLRREHRNLVAVAQFAIDQGWHRHAWQIVCCLQPLLKLSNYGGTALELFEGAVRAAQALEDRHGESLSLMGAALVLRERKLNARATSLMEQAIAISRGIDDRSTELYQVTGLGVVWLNDGHLKLAYDCFTEARTLAAALNDQSALAALRNNLGAVCVDLGCYDEALGHLQHALARRRANGDRQSEATVLTNVGLAHYRQRRYADAAIEFERALHLCDATTHPHIKITAWTGLCLVQRARGALEEAIHSGGEALRLARRARLPELECDALIALGDALLTSGDRVQAMAAYVNARDIATRYHLILCGGRVQEGFAHLASAEDNLATARAAWERALELYPEEAGEAENARRHLAGLGSSHTPCVRCEIASDSERA